MAVVAAIAAPAASLSSPASAQGLFDFLFGGFHQPAPSAPPSSSYIDPRDPGASTGVRRMDRSESRETHESSGGAPTVSFCVRTCDGKYFPIPTQSRRDAVAACNSFCPASETAIYRGTNIDNASDAQGHRYSRLENAFAYRKQVVAGCTCTGKSSTGLAKIDVRHDPTLRKGDIVATEDGFVAYTGSRNNVAQFTPVPDYKGLGQHMRRTLSETKISGQRELVDSVAMDSAVISPSDGLTDERRAALQ